MTNLTFTTELGEAGSSMVDEAELSASLRALLPDAVFSVVEVDGACLIDIDIDIDDDMRQSVSDLVAANIAGAVSRSLAHAKRSARDDINDRTSVLISMGFEYPAASGHVFSMSDTAQRNLSELDKLRSVLTYPFAMATVDDFLIDAVTSAEDLHARYLTALGRIQWAYGTGNAIKAAINAAEDEAALALVVDSR